MILHSLKEVRTEIFCRSVVGYHGHSEWRTGHCKGVEAEDDLW